MAGISRKGSEGQGPETLMQVAFRMKTNAPILGANIVLAGGADTYPAPPAPPGYYPELIAFFSSQSRNATCGSPPSRGAMDSGDTPWLCPIHATVCPIADAMEKRTFRLRQKAMPAGTNLSSRFPGRTPNACHGSPPWRDAMDFRDTCIQRDWYHMGSGPTRMRSVRG